MADPFDDLLATFFLVILFGLLGLGLWFMAAPGSKAPVRSKPVARKKPLPARATRASRPAGGALPLRRRVISLHSITPGQSPYEYNIGDNQGTRGSALVRAA
ncbi:MAG: hypothetical protein WDO69_15005 [Pseudomonadota bacterium]